MSAFLVRVVDQVGRELDSHVFETHHSAGTCWRRWDMNFEVPLYWPRRKWFAIRRRAQHQRLPLRVTIEVVDR